VSTYSTVSVHHLEKPDPFSEDEISVLGGHAHRVQNQSATPSSDLELLFFGLTLAVRDRLKQAADPEAATGQSFGDKGLS
jgi:hypothetical protein